LGLFDRPCVAVLTARSAAMKPRNERWKGHIVVVFLARQNLIRSRAWARGSGSQIDDDPTVFGFDQDRILGGSRASRGEQRSWELFPPFSFFLTPPLLPSPSPPIFPPCYPRLPVVTSFFPTSLFRRFHLHLCALAQRLGAGRRRADQRGQPRRRTENKRLSWNSRDDISISSHFDGRKRKT